MKQAAANIAPATIRPATPDDVGELAKLIALLATHHGDKSTTNPDRLRADLFSSHPWGTALVAETADGIQGYALLIRLYRGQYAQRIMDLHHLFVRPTARGAGIGAALVRAAIYEATSQGCGRVTVGTLAGNERAQALYRRLGFAEVSRSPSAQFRFDVTPAGSHSGARGARARNP